MFKYFERFQGGHHVSAFTRFVHVGGGNSSRDIATVKQYKGKVPGLSAVYDEMSDFFKKDKIKITSAPSER